MNTRFGVAVSLPLLALALQWLLWQWIDPFVWFLFFPAVFFSARLGGLRAGMASTLLSIVLVWFFFMPPQLSWRIAHTSNLISMLLFLAMGYLFSSVHERLHRARRDTAQTLTQAHAAHQQVTQLYRRTLELDELKPQFFANITHELRTPLTLIMGPLARRLAQPGEDPTQRAEDEMMLRNARLLYRHVSDLLDTAKVEAGQMLIHYQHVDLGALTRAMASQFDSLARDRRIDYRIDVPAVMQAQADGPRVQRVLLNLLSNAFKFTPEGGRIEVQLREDAADAVIEVRDNGAGVPADQREAVFERFRQGGGAVSSHLGTGLGLIIARQFAELHGGQASVTELRGGGATFVIRLPLQAPPGAVVEPTAPVLDTAFEHLVLDQPPVHGGDVSGPGPAGRQAPLVLVVEDNADMAAFVAQALRPHFRLASAPDGQSGLAQAMALRPDLILCDVMMPRMNGEEMLAQLRQQPDLAEVPVIMLMAPTDGDLRVRLLSGGAQDCLDKPFSVDELLLRAGGLIRLQQRARSDLERFEQIVATSGDMLVFIDPQLRYVVTNPAYAALFDTTPAALHGRCVADVVGPASYDQIAPRIERALAGEVQRFVSEPTLADGRRRMLDVEYRPFIRHGEVQGVVASLRDITELKAADAALLASEERLRLTLDATSDGFWDWDLRSGVIYRSPRYRELAGVAPEEASADFDFFARLVHPDDLPQVMQTIDALRCGDVATIEFDFRLVTRNAGPRWIRSRGRTVERDRDGKPLRVVGTITDISARKADEEALQRQAQELAERNVELERFNQAMVGRELDMIALKQQVNELLRRLGEPPRFALGFVEHPARTTAGKPT